jgi:mono/diheme cytochrome c family protein
LKAGEALCGAGVPPAFFAWCRAWDNFGPAAELPTLKPRSRSRDFISEEPFLWHNGAERKFMKNIFPPANARKRCGPSTIPCITLSAMAAILLLAPPAPRAQTAAPQAEKSEAPPAGNAENGKKIFTKDGCYECHGREGQGAAQGAGPRIGPLQLSFEGFTKYVHQPTGQMPPYTTKVISDQELADIFAYLRSRPKATSSKDIPLLNQ